jgi:MFS family permease
MKILRHLIGFLLACLVGVLLPIAASVYDALYPRNHGSHEPTWTIVSNAEIVGLESASVGSVAGAVGIGLLHRLHRSKFRDYVTAGASIGAICGAFLTVMFNLTNDRSISWFMFITLVAVSMALGFICYWLVSIRGHES